MTEIERRIDQLPLSSSPSRLHILAAMRDGVTERITVGQVLDLVIGSPPGALDTLDELAAALADDANFAATVVAALALKADAAAMTSALAGKASLTGIETLTNKTLTSPTLNNPTLVLKQSTSPAQTAEGAIEWDTDDDALVVGTGSGRKVYRPTSWEQIAVIDITSPIASQDVAIPSWARQIRITGYGIPVTSSAAILLRAAVGGVFNSTAGAYQFQFSRADTTTVDAARDTTTQTGFNLLPGSNNGANGGGTFNLLLTEVNQSRHTYASNRNSYLSPGGNIVDLSSSGVFISANPLSDLRFVATSGNISILNAVIEASR